MSLAVRIPPPTVNGMSSEDATFLTKRVSVFLFAFVAVMSRKTISSAPSSRYCLASSTGSPASLSPLNLTPLTTLPSLTSRHGIIRLARGTLSHLQLSQPNRSFVQRPTDNHAVQPLCAQPCDIIGEPYSA